MRTSLSAELACGRTRAKLYGISLALLAAAVLLDGCAAKPVATGPSPEPTATPAQRTTEPADPRVLGSATAPVTIIEFTDLQCPYCARFALETWPALRERYVDTGKVRFASRDLPLPMHAAAVPAAIAARCAGEQGRFFEYREALFRGQSQLDQAPYDALAGRFGLDVERFAACRRNPAIAAAVRQDAALAAANGVAATPTFIVGREVDGQFSGEIVEGALSFEAFAARIDALLPPK